MNYQYLNVLRLKLTYFYNKKNNIFLLFIILMIMMIKMIVNQMINQIIN